VKLNTVPLGTPAFVDRTVIPGLTYFYVAAAVNSRGARSPFSNEIRARIPIS
jgi:hypothetical protein